METHLSDGLKHYISPSCTQTHTSAVLLIFSPLLVLLLSCCCLVVVLGMRVLRPLFCEVQHGCMNHDSCRHAALLSKRAEHTHEQNNNKTRQDNKTRHAN